jgi:hypothetical protein
MNHVRILPIGVVIADGHIGIRTRTRYSCFNVRTGSRRAA